MPQRRAWLAWWLAAGLLAGWPRAAAGAPSAARSRSASTASAAARRLYREDFNGPRKLSVGWEARGRITVRRIDLAGKPALAGVGGKVAHVAAKPGGVFCTRPTARPPEFARADRAVFRIRVPAAGPDRPVVLEVRFYARGRRAGWWRKVQIDAPAWREVSLPLRYFRPSSAARAKWRRVDRWGFYFRTAAEVYLDGIELIAGASADAAYLSLDELSRIAFLPPRRVRRASRKPFVLLTDSTAIRPERVLDELEQMRKRLTADFPSWPRPDRPVPLLIFADAEGHRAFWRRLAKLLNSRIKPPVTPGFSTMGIATAAADREAGRVRPTFVHEAVHAWAEQAVGLGNVGEWFQEGLACRYQLAFSKQDISGIVRRGAADASFRLPFNRLLDGRRIPMLRYWQAAIVIEWLLDDPARRTGFDRAIAEFRRRGSTDFRGLMGKCLGMTVAEAEAAWLAWAANRYRAGGPLPRPRDERERASAAK